MAPRLAAAAISGPLRRSQRIQQLPQRNYREMAGISRPRRHRSRNIGPRPQQPNVTPGIRRGRGRPRRLPIGDAAVNPIARQVPQQMPPPIVANFPPAQVVRPQLPNANDNLRQTSDATTMTNDQGAAAPANPEPQPGPSRLAQPFRQNLTMKPCVSTNLQRLHEPTVGSPVPVPPRPQEFEIVIVNSKFKSAPGPQPRPGLPFRQLIIKPLVSPKSNGNGPTGLGCMGGGGNEQESVYPNQNQNLGENAGNLDENTDENPEDNDQNPGNNNQNSEKPNPPRRPNSKNGAPGGDPDPVNPNGGNDETGVDKLEGLVRKWESLTDFTKGVLNEIRDNQNPVDGQGPPPPSPPHSPLNVPPSSPNPPNPPSPHLPPNPPSSQLTPNPPSPKSPPYHGGNIILEEVKIEDMTPEELADLV